MSIKKKVEKRKSSRGWYRNEPEFIGIAQYCVDHNLSETSSLKLIEEHFGRSISGRNFRRVKKILPMSNSERIETVNEDWTRFILESIIILRSNENILFNILKDPNTSVGVKFKACDSISKNRLVMAQFYDTSPIITTLSQIKGDDVNVIQKPEEIPGKKLP